jgi:SAM-dependent methyltransferase
MKTEGWLMESSRMPPMQEDVVFTGERLVLNSSVLAVHPEVFAEHMYRYRLAQRFCAGKKVLDAACGTGYGSQMLKRAGARAVEGLDIDTVSIAYAVRDYAGSGITFRQGNVLQLPYPDKTFDVVVSFETIEHVPNGADWLREAARVLKPGGLFIVSTPNREVSNPDRAFGEPLRNPFHHFEYSLGEFIGELCDLYQIEAVYGQTFYGPSGWLPPDPEHIREALAGGDPALQGVPPDKAQIFGPVALARIKNAKPTFVVAICRLKSM